MKISTRTRYGLRFLLHLALHTGKGPMQLKDIAEKEQISDKYLEQIIIVLKPSGIIRSVRGAYGGYALAKPAEKITLKDVFEILEGGINVIDETDSDQLQSNEGSTAHEIWQAFNSHISQFLAAHTLEDLAKLSLKKNTSQMFYI